MSRIHRLPLLVTLGLGIGSGFLADRLLDVSPPTAEAQTRISLADLQAQIATLQTQVTALQTQVAVLPTQTQVAVLHAGLQNIDASQITTGTLVLARLPASGYNASYLQGWALSNAAPVTGQTLRWDGVQARWSPSN